MVEVSYHCPYCGAVTSIERGAYLADKCVTREPLDGWEYAPTTGDLEAADGIEFVCLGDPDGAADGGAGGATGPDPSKEGCGRTFYLSFVRFDGGEPIERGRPADDPPRFDFLR